MQRFPRYCLLCTVVLASTVMALSFSQRLRNRPDPPLTLDGWDIRKLTDHLNRAGLAVRLRTSQKDGTLANTPFLTTADESWEHLNRLVKDSSGSPSGAAPSSANGRRRKNASGFFACGRVTVWLPAPLCFTAMTNFWSI